MAYSEITREAVDGLQAYRQTLADIHADVAGAVDLNEIRARLAHEGYVTQTPLVTIPYDPGSLEAASWLKASHPWTDPFATGNIDDAYEKVSARAQGVLAWETGFPTPFWSALVDVAVVYDDSALNASDFGKTYAKGKAVAEAAHEIAHSAFAGITTNRFRKSSERQVQVHTRAGIGQAPQMTTLMPGSAEVPAYEPMWIDEAVATHAAAKVRAGMWPQSMPKEPILWDDELSEFYGASGIELPPKYLIYSDEFPDEPGTAAGAEGVGIDLLIAKRPALLPNVKALAAGMLSIVAFHRGLLNDVGAELYESITERRPYGIWGGILEQIKELRG